PLGPPGVSGTGASRRPLGPPGVSGTGASRRPLGPPGVSGTGASRRPLGPPAVSDTTKLLLMPRILAATPGKKNHRNLKSSINPQCADQPSKAFFRTQRIENRVSPEIGKVARVLAHRHLEAINRRPDLPGA